MLANIESVKMCDRPQIYREIYYISGYIVECMLKFFILEVKHYKNTTITPEELKNIGLWTHDIKHLLKIAMDSSGFRFSVKDFHKITLEWNVDKRYETDHPDYKDSILVEKHYKDSVLKFYDTIKNKY